MSLDYRTLSAVAELGYALIRGGQLRDARRIWEGIAGEAGGLEAPWRALALIALREGRFEDCVAAAGVANQRQPASPAPLVLRAEALMRLGHYAEASADLEAALALPPRSDADVTVQRCARAMSPGRSGGLGRGPSRNPNRSE